MERKLLLDIETGGFQVEDEIYEVAVLVIENGEIIDSLHLGKLKMKMRFMKAWEQVMRVLVIMNTISQNSKVLLQSILTPL